MSAARSPENAASRRRLFQRPSRPELRAVGAVLRTETAGGVLLLTAAVVALAWANSPWRAAYTALRDYVPWPGGGAFGYDLDLAHWAAGGLLAIFFFVVGLELKREFVTGALRNISVAVIPVVAAVGGMVAPALLFLAVNAGLEGGSLRGWAVPTATDIAFALAVLAVIGAALPAGLRVFLLTLAVVDDLLAILVIALFFTDDFHAIPLALAALPLAAFALLVQRHHVWPVLLVPLAAAAWTLVLASGVHPTVAGVALGATVPVRTREPDAVGLAEHLEHLWRPVSAGVAVPVFAFFAAGVSVPLGSLFDLLRDPVALGVVLGLVGGKLVGVFGATWLLATFTRAELDEELAWSDIAGVALLAGIGFTVSLLIGGLAYGGSERVDTVTVAVLAGSLLSAVLASAVLRRRAAVYRRLG